MNKRIDQFLSSSARTRSLASLPLGRDRQVTVWQNSHDRISYQATAGHVFSLYLQGGSGTRRVDGRAQAGKPGTLCIFPEGHASEWEITEQFQFVHLYVADEALRSAFAQIHDLDARRLDMSERIFTRPGNIEPPLQRLAMAAMQNDVLAADASFADTVAALQDRPIQLNGGLAPKILSDLRDWVDAHLDQEVRLNDLAQMAGLSDYHFHRMFAQTCGAPPHRWITALRVQKAKRQLINTPTAEVALACGFSSQSHFIRRFKEAMGITPGRYAKLVQM